MVSAWHNLHRVPEPPEPDALWILVLAEGFLYWQELPTEVWSNCLTAPRLRVSQGLEYAWIRRASWHLLVAQGLEPAWNPARESWRPYRE